MATITVTPDLNLLSLIDFADEKRVPQARYCEGCSEEHHPRRAPSDGARYFIDGRWLCVACRCK